MAYLKIEKSIANGVSLIRINRPAELNALNLDLMKELAETIQQMDADEHIRAIVITGNEKAFAAGADIKQMTGRSTIDMMNIDQFKIWDQIKKRKLPLIAAVSGYALGGGCELAMQCDMIIAGETATFGQPEIKIGVMPGAGGTQRLTRAIGKVRAMETILTGAFISAEQALQWGLVNRIVPSELCIEEAVKLAEKVAQMPPVAVRLAKEAVDRAFETSLEEGLHFERKNFYLTFSSDDQQEGMQAFIEKRKPHWKGK